LPRFVKNCLEFKMKHLRQYIRQILLAEAAKTHNDMPKGYWVGMREADGEWARWEIMKGSRSYYEAVYDGPVRGFIEIGRVHKDMYGNCLDAWNVRSSNAAEGFGPMLYDLAIEYATDTGSGLISDRGTVSPSARAVWEYYDQNRSDIEKIQLDNRQDTFNNGPEDDCSQDVTFRSDNKVWKESSLSKMYRARSSDKIKELEKAGKLIRI
jgi:hypothetical protein